MDRQQKLNLRNAVLIALAIAIGLALLLRVIGIGGADEDAGERPLAAPARVKVVAGETHLTLSAQERESGGIAFEDLKAVTYQDRAAAFGAVVSPQALAEQRKSLLAAIGDAKRSELAVDAARLEVKRLQPLHRDDRIVSDKALESAQVALAGEEANASVASTQLRAQQAAAAQQWGSVISQWLTDGSPELDRLLAGQEMLVLITLPAGQTVSGQIGAELEIGSQPAMTVTVVSSVPQSDPRFQGQGFYVRMPSSAGLRPGMTVAGSILIGAPVSGIFLPDAAVVRWRGHAWVYVETATHDLVRRPVETDSSMPDGWFVRSGLKAGTPVVVRGAQLVLSEEMKASATPEGAK